MRGTQSPGAADTLQSLYHGSYIQETSLGGLVPSVLSQAEGNGTHVLPSVLSQAEGNGRQDLAAMPPWGVPCDPEIIEDVPRD